MCSLHQRYWLRGVGENVYRTIALLFCEVGMDSSCWTVCSNEYCVVWYNMAFCTQLLRFNVERVPCFIMVDPSGARQAWGMKTWMCRGICLLA